MARWKLLQKHYLNVPGTTWEYKERTYSGRMFKKNIPCPLLLDPDDATDCNYNAGETPRSDADIRRGDPGEIIVAYSEGAKPKDIIFIGDPTPDMVPLDEEAKEISASLLSKWGAPAETMDGDYTGAVLQSLTETLNSFNASQHPSGFMPDEATVKRIDGLEAQLKMLMEMNVKLIEQNTILANHPIIRRV